VHIYNRKRYLTQHISKRERKEEREREKKRASWNKKVTHAGHEKRRRILSAERERETIKLLLGLDSPWPNNKRKRIFSKEGKKKK